MGKGLSRGWRMMSSYLRAAGGMRSREGHRWGVGTGASRTVHALRSLQKARISVDLHDCATWMSMPLTALEPLDRSSQPARFVVLDDLRLQVDRVEHRSRLPDAACTTSAQGSKLPLRRGGEAGQRALGVLSVLPVVSVRLCAR